MPPTSKVPNIFRIYVRLEGAFGFRKGIEWSLNSNCELYIKKKGKNITSYRIERSKHRFMLVDPIIRAMSNPLKQTT